MPSSRFAGADANSFVYLYSHFGDNFTANAGFEEWAVAKSALTNAHASISGTVTDTYGSGVADVVVFLDANHNGVMDNNEVYTVTDANGNYSFNNLVGGAGTNSFDFTHWAGARSWQGSRLRRSDQDHQIPHITLRGPRADEAA